MSNGWYQLENSKAKRTPAHIAEFQYREARRAEPIPAPPLISVPEEIPEPPSQEAPAAVLEAAAPGPTPTPAANVTQVNPHPTKLRKVELLPDPYHDECFVQHSQTVGPRGPVVLQDTVLHETINAFIDKKLPERAVHAKGFGAFGQFECYQSMTEHTMLPFLRSSGQKTAVATRFSLAVSTKGTPDTARNVRGFSTKFYTSEGVFDLLCNHLPVFLIQDAIRFPEAIGALLPSPVNNLIDPDRFWSFVARAPESLHFVTWLFSDAGTLKSFRHMKGHGVNTYVWKNSRGSRKYVKYHWLPMLGVQYITSTEAVRLAGENPDVAGQDLFDAIARGEYPEYELCVQLMDPEDAAGLSYDPLDDTKIWDETQYPLRPVGRLRLDRNPEDYMEQIEKLAFSPANLLEGAGLSDDKMLQGRSFAYWDAQRRRLGPNFRKIPVNRQENWAPDQLVSSGLGMETQGIQVRSERSGADHFTQAGMLFHTLSTEQQANLADNLAVPLAHVPESVRETVLGYFYCASEDYGNLLKNSIQKLC